MLVSDILEEIGFSLLSNKSRSALTILGIVIGIGSVIALVSVGQGSAKSITERVQSLGTNLLTVMPGAQRNSIVSGGIGSAQNLTIEDANAIKGIDGVAIVAPVVSGRKQVTVKGKNTNTSIYGIDNNYFTVRSIEIEFGSNFTDAQLKSKSRVAIIGPTTRDNLFDAGSDPTGQKIRIAGQEFTVIGSTKSKGGTGFGSSDDLVYIPLSTAQQYVTGNSKLNNIAIQVSSADMMNIVQSEVEALLLERHNISDPTKADFSIMNQADMLSTMSSVSNTLTLLLGAIAGISLLVGGIGIMNMMLTTVTERTREIGLRKSLGAKNKDITIQFLMESAALTLIGGIIGIIIGWLASWLIQKLSGITTVVTSWSIIMSFGVSALVGLVFGFYPARRAAQLDPIDALRYQ